MWCGKRAQGQSPTFTRQTWAPHPSPPPWLRGAGQVAGVKPQYPLKRAIILPHGMILGLNEINICVKHWHSNWQIVSAR